MLPELLSPRHLRAGEGAKARVITDLVTTKAVAADTGGAYSLFELLTPPAGGCPPHTQRYDDETVYVLAGRYAFLVGEHTVELGAGDYLFIPRGTLHAFANPGATAARMLILITPGGIQDGFINEVGDPADRAPWAPSMARVLAVAPKYGIEFTRPVADGQAEQPRRAGDRADDGSPNERSLE